MRHTLALIRKNKTTIALIAIAIAANWYWWTVLESRSPAARQRRVETSIVGSAAMPIVGKGPTGAWERLEFGAEAPATILYAISPTCGWCTRNTANVQALAAHADGRYRVIGLFLGSQGDPEQYARTHGLTFPMYSMLSDQSKHAYNLGGTPQTIVVKDGRIVANWVGAYSEALKYEVETFFGVTMPGLLSEEPASQGPGRQVVTCTVPDGGLYSPGAVRTEDGKTVRCDAAGKWQAAAGR